MEELVSVGRCYAAAPYWAEGILRNLLELAPVFRFALLRSFCTKKNSLFCILSVTVGSPR